MRKIIFLLILSFFLPVICFGQSSADDPYTTDEDHQLSRRYADDLQSRYGISILIDEECIGIADDDTHTVGSKVYTTPFMSAFTPKSTSEALKELEKALKQYPEGFLSSLRDKVDPNGLRILIANEIVTQREHSTVYGYATNGDGYYSIVLTRTIFSQSTVHHELWHVIEKIISNAYPNAFAEWSTLNPEGFKYGGSTDTDPGYFVSRYSTADEYNDRATIAEQFFQDNAEEWFKIHPAIQKKLDHMNEVLSQVLDYQYNTAINK